jgi:hypothetical protein
LGCRDASYQEQQQEQEQEVRVQEPGDLQVRQLVMALQHTEQGLRITWRRKKKENVHWEVHNDSSGSSDNTVSNDR